MAKVSVYNKEGKEVETMELNDTVFAAPVMEQPSMIETKAL